MKGIKMEFKDTEFEMTKAYKEFKKGIKKMLNQRFTNADSIRNMEDNSQLALLLWNMPKFNAIEELQEWLNKDIKK